MSQGPDLYDPDWYVDGPVHETFAELRRTEPVRWQDIPGDTGYWAVLRHADVVHVARHPEVFSAWEGGVVLETLEGEGLDQMRHMLLAMDPPRHTAYRQPLAPHFGARVIGRMEEQIRGRCRAILDAAAGRDEVDLCHDVAGPLPAQVIGELMGLPAEDTAQIQRWAELQTSVQDEEVTAGYEGNPSMEMAVYGMAWAATRREQPRRDDITALLLESTFEDGQPMTDVDFGSFFVQLVTAGNDTTKTMLAGGTFELLRHPDQLRALREDPSLLPGAVEEVLRWCNPLHYFRRTASIDVELGGQQVRAGDKVAMIYTSANRDEEAFAEADRFDIRRNPNPHLSFGIGAHFCLGAHLARLEARIFFEELLSTFSTIELAGEPARVRSNLNNGFKRLPVRLRP
ncbi:MAG: cytochrome [Actinomycetia bacterium]|nr:cytochrome [Actinomycetes bacterium]